MRPGIHQLVSCLVLGATLAMAQQLPRPLGGPPATDTSETVHIQPTDPDVIGTGSNSGPSWLTLSGFTLQLLLSDLYRMPVSRIDFEDPEARQFADERLDIVLNLPAPESRDAMRLRIVNALQERLHLAIEPVTRTADGYAITIANAAKLKQIETPSGRGASIHVVSGSFSMRDSTRQPLTPQDVQQALQHQRQTEGVALDSIHMEGTIGDLCRALEDGLHSPVLDRTGFNGAIKLNLERNGLSRDQFFARIEHAYGLAIHPARAPVEHLAVSHVP